MGALCPRLSSDRGGAPGWVSHTWELRVAWPLQWTRERRAFCLSRALGFVCARHPTFFQLALRCTHTCVSTTSPNCRSVPGIMTLKSRGPSWRWLRVRRPRAVRRVLLTVRSAKLIREGRPLRATDRSFYVRAAGPLSSERSGNANSRTLFLMHSRLFEVRITRIQSRLPQLFGKQATMHLGVADTRAK